MNSVQMLKDYHKSPANEHKTYNEYEADDQQQPYDASGGGSNISRTVDRNEEHDDICRLYGSA